MCKKYELTDQSINFHGHKLFRIKALRDIDENNEGASIKKGDLGGFVEKEENLSQEGDCWIYGNAKVYENAKICDQASIACEAEVFGNAVVFGYADVHGYAKVYGNALIYDIADIFGYAEIFDNAKVHDNSWVHDNAKVYGNSNVCNNTHVHNNTKLVDGIQLDSIEIDKTIWDRKDDFLFMKDNVILNNVDDFYDVVIISCEKSYKIKTIMVVLNLLGMDLGTFVSYSPNVNGEEKEPKWVFAVSSRVRHASEYEEKYFRNRWFYEFIEKEAKRLSSYIDEENQKNRVLLASESIPSIPIFKDNGCKSICFIGGDI